MNPIVLFFIYFLLVSSSLWQVQTKLQLLSPGEKQSRRLEAWAYRVLVFVPVINLFVWLWVMTEGLETQCPQAGKSWTGGG